MENIFVPQYKIAIAEIANLRWTELDAQELHAVATAYYYFSIQFRENLLIAVSMFPNDEKLQHLKSEECETSNLSPWPSVAEPGERMNHRRVHAPHAAALVPAAGDHGSGESSWPCLSAEVPRL